jgi:T4-like virus Myoviridae tail sheath stabiliser
MALVQFAYDAQIRRFVLQFIRLVSNFQVEFGADANGNKALQAVPVYYGDVSRQAAMILRNNSENSLNAVPAMAAYINGFSYDRDRVLNPTFEGSIRIREQVYDQVSQSYNGQQDGLYTVDRLMPAPYKLSMKLDIWTSNTEQKHQILEQITPLFNPALEIQNSDNYVDWGSLSAVFLTDVAYTNRTVPMGNNDTTIDIATLSFEMPIWISLPAKVKKMGVITDIISNVYDANGELNPDVVTNLNGLMIRGRTTPMNYEVLYLGNSIQVYQAGAHESGDTIYGRRLQWKDVVILYGKLTNGISEIRLTFENNTGKHEIVGHVAYDPTDSYNLLFTPVSGTLPVNTLPAVDAIIDPYTVNVDSYLLNPAVGTRYLILNPIGDAMTESAIAWAGAEGTNLIAHKNDIIEYSSHGYWVVSFDSRSISSPEYVTNLKTTVQYRWTGAEWVKSYEGFYPAGAWSLVL